MPVSPASPMGSTQTNATGYDLFASGNVGVGQSVVIGDLAGALLFGTIGYIFIVLFFLFGHLKSIFAFFKMQNEGRSRSQDFTLVRHYMGAFGWFASGILIFSLITATLSSIYNIDIVGRIDFFWEARYELIVGNLQTTVRNGEIARGVLFILDIFSRFAYWSIVFIFLGAASVAFFYTISLLSDFSKEGNSSEGAVGKAFLAGVGAAFGEVVLFSIYAVVISKLLLSSAPTIHGVGVVSSVGQIIVQSLRYFVNLGLG